MKTANAPDINASQQKNEHTLDFCDVARQTIRSEIDAITQVSQRIDAQFEQACTTILACQGRTIITGMGKSGHIGNKIAATLASTGTPAFYVHPAEASHGDMGMITRKDVVLAISNSGETTEIITILPLIKRLNIPLIAMTGNPQSALAKNASIHLDISIEREACPLGLAPTSSTTASLVVGDALAIALLQARGFTSEDFAFSHPGGRLGRRLLLKISDVMRTGNDIPIVLAKQGLDRALIEMTQKSLGLTGIVEQAGGPLLGVFTDGDLRRTLDKGIDIHATPINEIMTRNCKTVSADLLAAQAIQLMEEHSITALFVVNDQQVPIGILHMHDMLRAGVV